MRRLSLAALLVAAVFVWSASALAGGRPTTVVSYQPFNAAGALKGSITVEERHSGSCVSSSRFSPRRDAWRCSADEVYDPCFSPPSGTVSFVVCPEFGDPPRRVTRIDLTDPLPAPRNTGSITSTRGQPWSVLARPYAGYCNRSTGPPRRVRGRPVRYACGLGGWLVGKIDRSKARWTGRLLTEGDNPTLYRVRVRIAWF